jgi:chorismate mutase
VALRALRGATQLPVDTAEEMSAGVVELITEVLERNALTTEDLVAIVFTATSDLRAEFPAAAARSLDLGDVPLLCAQELDVVGAMPRVVRVMVFADLDVPRSQVVHVYLRGAVQLRSDLAQ